MVFLRALLMSLWKTAMGLSTLVLIMEWTFMMVILFVVTIQTHLIRILFMEVRLI